MRLRITTWNVNSIRLRLDQLALVVERVRPDVLCLQETKVEDAKFPFDAVREMGFPHVFVHGQKTWHGVATLSRLPLSGCEAIRWCNVEDCRHTVCHLPGELELHNLYIPAGGDVPDPEVNPRFRHKLEMLEALAEWFEARRGRAERVILVGDLNVAPLPTDVWNHRALLNVVSHTPVEVEALERLRRSLPFVDAVRAKIPPEEKVFTWWSYRARDWRRSNRGRRLDHIWLSPDLAPYLVSVRIDDWVRDLERPSDHVPVTVELDLPDPWFGDAALRS